MRVLHFAESFSQPTETFIKRFVQKSTQFSHVAVVAFNFQHIDNELKDTVSFFEITGKVYTRKTITGALRYVIEKLTGRLYWYKQLDKIIKSFNPDIIHCHFGNTGIMMMQFNHVFKTNVPYVTSFYGYDVSSQPFVDKKYRSELTRLWQQGTGFFAEGPELIKKMVALGCAEPKCMLNSLLIPVEKYPVKETYRTVSDPVRFLFAGRFIEKKGLHLFLEAIGKLKNDIPAFSIDIMGSGPMKGRYDQTIAQYHLESYINWLGFVKHEDVINRLKDYDFLIHPSLTSKDNDSEGGAPTIIIEAQAAALPVIASNHADIPYTMGYQDFLAIESDINSLITIIKKAVNCNDIQRYAKQGIAKVHQVNNLHTNTTYETNLNKLYTPNLPLNVRHTHNSPWRKKIH